jgi:hypothetical protein
LLIAGSAAFVTSSANAVVVTFDDTAAVSGAAAASYLSGYGINFIAGGGIAPHVFVAPTWSPAVSSPNLFGTSGPGTGYFYTFDFTTLMNSVSFTRPQLIALTSSGVTHAQWSATAYSASNVVLGSVGEGMISSFGTVAAATFTLNGPGIDRIDFFTNVANFAGTNLIIDNLVLNAAAAVPAPAPITMVLAGLLLLGWTMRRPAQSRAKGAQLDS